MRYAVCLESKYKANILNACKSFDLIVVDAQDFTSQEIAKMKESAKVLSYINVGAVESDRSYFKTAKSKGLLLGKYDNWDGEYWVDARQKAWSDIILGVAKDIRAKGVDGFWVDNLDILYTAEEEYNWNSSKLRDLYNSLQSILTALGGYVLINGADVFVSKAIKAKQTPFAGVNQETVFSCITDYDPPGKFGKQDKEERAYYQEYLHEVKMAGKDIFLLEYTKDAALIKEAQDYCNAQGFTLCVSSTIELGGDIKVATKSGTRWDVLEAATKYDGSSTAHTDVIRKIKTLGHTMSASTAWCTETVIAIFSDAGCLNLIGGYAGDAPTLKRHAQSLGIWHSGSSGILPGCPVLFKGSDGKPNHTELAVGSNVTISGNHNGKCDRRSWSGRNVDGWISPKYPDMGTMDNLQVCIAACDVLLGVYGTSTTREKMLQSFGKANATAIQAEVNRIVGDTGKVPFDMAVYAIAGHAGKSSYRTTRLKTYAPSAQKKINDIYALSGNTVTQAAQLVLDNQFGTGAIRTLLLKFCGYDAVKVQAEVNRLLQEKKPPSAGQFRVYPVWFFQKDESAYGDCTAVIEYDSLGRVAHCVLIDTAMARVAPVVVSKLKAQGITAIDAVIISHGHGDHYGGLSDIMKSIPVRHIYIPDTAGLDRYQKSYGDALRRQAAKAPSTVMKVGGTYTVGKLLWKCAYQAPAGSLSEHDDHHFVNNQSAVLRFNLGGVVFHTAGDLQNEGNNLLVKAVPDLKADIFKCQWHGDANATNEAICKAVRPKVAFSNYHHKERSGRETTRKRLEAVGAKVYRNSEDGDIFIDIKDGVIAVTTRR